MASAAGWDISGEVEVDPLPRSRLTVQSWHFVLQHWAQFPQGSSDTDREKEQAVSHGSKWGILQVIVSTAKGLGGGSTAGKENRTQLASNYTRVIVWPQRGSVGVTESPEYPIKPPPACCSHRRHPEVLRCCRYDHSPNYRVTGQATGERKQPQTFWKGTHKHELFGVLLLWCGAGSRCLPPASQYLPVPPSDCQWPPPWRRYKAGFLGAFGFNK